MPHVTLLPSSNAMPLTRAGTLACVVTLDGARRGSIPTCPCKPLGPATCEQCMVELGCRPVGWTLTMPVEVDEGGGGGALYIFLYLIIYTVLKTFWSKVKKKKGFVKKGSSKQI